VTPTTGYCLVWENELEKRDADKAETREKSPFDIAMPYWTTGAL
jgi:hypothetical protein